MRLVPKNLRAPIVLAVLLTALFAVNYISSGHEPIATDMPFGVVGSSPLPDDAQGPLFSLDVTQYANQAAATQAMDKGKSYGTLIAGDASGSANQLTVVSSISDLSALDIAGNFEDGRQEERRDSQTRQAVRANAARSQRPLRARLLTRPRSAPRGRATWRDAADHRTRSRFMGQGRSSSGRWHGVWLLGFAVVTGLVVDLIVTSWLKGLPSDSFWIAWPIMALIILTSP